ncbi:BMP family protein [Hydrogenoanaerobacterium sp.]|uniref:BMP family protein n=1 Tax=Hydrogenoanaerobacterium sp. TaxID=2953763 RepID=UPI00289821B2|nr:BMP family protein [Hydrogenoanaerobacterium sp.]
MKKILALILAVIMVATVFAGCGAKPVESVAPESESAPSESPAPVGKDPKDLKVILICDKIGTNPFLTQMQTGLDNMKEKYGLSTSIVECADASVWEDNIRAAVQEQNDLIIVAGGQGADPISAVATEFPDDATYVMVDVKTDNPNVKSITFKEQEGAYLIGMIAGLVNKTDKFGAVHANEGQSSYKWRWGYMEGVKAVRPNAEFIFNYTNSYTDAAKAKEFALQQAAAGCGFINAASAVADFGTFEAALEKGFYTSGQDQDRTSPDNKNIITTQIKDTAVVIEKIVTEFVEGSLTMEAESYGIKEYAIGALYITRDSKNPRNTEVLTDEIVAQVKEAADKIIEGEIVLEVPMEGK